MSISAILSNIDRESKSVEGGAIVIALMSVFAGVLGILRNAILASKFGASQELDIYFAAFRIPDFIYSILVFGALTAGFIPVFNKWLLEGKEHAWQLTSATMNSLTIILGSLAIMVALFANSIVEFIAPGFSNEAMNKVAELLRIMMIQPLFLAISNVAGASLQSFRRFFVSSAAPIFYNFGIIVGALWLVEVWEIKGLAFGVVLGAILHLLVQLPTLFSLGFKWSFGIRNSLQGIVEIFMLTLPRMVNLLIAQLNLFVITAIASVLSAGTLSIYNFAADLAGFPQILFGLSFATAAFPNLSMLWAEKKIEEYRKLFARTLAEMWFWIVIAMLISLAFREPIVRLTLFFGHFDQNAYQKTIDALTIFLFGLPGQAGILLLIRAFFAMGNSVIPLISALVGSIVTISISFWFGKIFAAAGLALGPTVAGFVQCAILLLRLRRELGHIDGLNILQELRNALILGMTSALSGWLTYFGLNKSIAAQDFESVLIKSFISASITLVVLSIGYFGLRILKVTRLQNL